MTHNKFLKLSLFLICMSFFLISGGGKALAANSWYVVPDSSDTTHKKIYYYQNQNTTEYSQSSWNSATTQADDLNTFLNGNPASGDTVYISSGDYKISGTISFGTAPNFKAVTVYGGFTDETSNIEGRSFSPGIQTVISQASGTGSLFSIRAGSTLDGLTVTDGSSNGISIVFDSNNDFHPTIKNCTIKNNKRGISLNGGNGTNSKITIDGCIITSNDNNNNGGGFYIENCSPDITNCTISSNKAFGSDYNGGGIYTKGGNPTITNCQIISNDADYRGGGFFIESGNPTITNCQIISNDVDYGGGFYIDYGNPAITSCYVAGNTNGGFYIVNGNPVITKCDIKGNTGKSGIYIDSMSSTLTIANCAVTDNTSTSNGGGINCDYGVSYDITNCVITGNIASRDGGGINIGNGNAKITNCTIASNTSQGIDDLNCGGGISIVSSYSVYSVSADISNCSIINNTANHYGGGIYVDKTGDNNVSADITNCTIVNNTASDKGHEIYNNLGEITLKNALIWNANAAQAVVNSDDNGMINCSYSVYPNATGGNNVSFDTWNNPKSADVEGTAQTPSGKITHTVYRLAENPVIFKFIGRGDSALTSRDQLGNTRSKMFVGAVDDTAGITISADISADSTNKKFTGTVSYVYAGKKITLESSDYTLAWSVASSPANTNITIDASGNLTVPDALSADHNVTVSLTVTNTTTAALANLFNNVVVSKTVTFAGQQQEQQQGQGQQEQGQQQGQGQQGQQGQQQGQQEQEQGQQEQGQQEQEQQEQEQQGSVNQDMTLTLTKNSDLPSGSVSTAYSATVANYFTLTGAPDGASVTWTVEGTLPGGLTFSNGVISGTATKAGTFDFTVVATASATGYNTASKDITASIVITVGDTIISSENGIEDFSQEEKANAVTLILTRVNDLSKINAAEFPMLSTIQISKDAEITNSTLDLSGLPETVTAFIINENQNVKSLNIKNTSLTTVEAKSCDILESVDIAGNTKLESIDVKGSGSLKVFKANDCANLREINCSECSISSFDITNSLKLVSVDCSYNRLLVLDLPSDTFTEVNYLNCISQSLGYWRPTVSLNFDDFAASPDLSGDMRVSDAEVKTSDFTKVSDFTAYDKDGKIISYTSDADGNITFTSKPDIFTYNYNTGHDEQLMDVTVYAADDIDSYLGSSGGCGCNVMRNEELGIRNVLILLFFEFLLLKLKIKRN